MYFITREQWDAIPDKDEAIKNKNFEIIESGEPDKDAIVCAILESLSELSPEDREKVRRLCINTVQGAPVEDFVNAAVKLVS